VIVLLLIGIAGFGLGVTLARIRLHRKRRSRRPGFLGGRR